ncbi:MAG TPA: HD-GYP domain-containing protein [Thauera aminoaromatica]|uniref:Metal dependent phosphohydrolase n=1 Tax=Thauera aminoaromatica TaxID=164330 RepID=C4KBM1_THASP|nr:MULTISPECIES: HD-GYP domain-containing protein [Thauera]TXH14953.1 MAG: HD-GYP domain-containing protein [Gammaproteobacteria bacterium]ACR01797.1 metal dependent phosphohydrolase [Thauera aminoaromatica]MBL8461227.1 HD-GYP domain-containing protein [Thauera sp.]MBP6132755.1 HD-GYP domain-containing protein [Thauera sp.]MBP7048510.1 HD-GYP domain-containing protein [Thauera sp.]
MNQTISTRELKIGMFVVAIDRPWTETPFMMQGFLLENVDQLRALQHYCRSVTIDRTRSIGDQYSAKVFDKDAPLRGADGFVRKHPDVTESRVGAQRFIKVARGFKGKIHTLRQPHVPRIRIEDGRSRLESELLYSAPIVDDVFRALRETQLAIDSNVAIDVPQISGLVGEMAAGVQRNPDALLWLTRLKRTDQYAYDHAVNVSVHAMVFARFLGLSGKQVHQLGLAGLLQDIGKVQIDYGLLSKPGPLDEREFEHVKAHVTHTVRLLQAHRDFDAEVLATIAAHHERFDGTGYPRGLEGMSIPLPAEMAGITDAYCAMTRDRVYREAVSSQRAMETLNQLRNTQFRDTLVDQFLQCIGLYPIGTLVELNSGEVGVVIQQNQVRRLQPRVLVLLAPDKSVERFPRTLDLLMQPDTADGEPYRILQALPPNAFGIDPNDFFLA